MNAPAEPVPPTVLGGTAPAPRPSSTSPVAVVWCRQVDNEAESPGYTTIPEEFPGHRETLDVIRIVGNLTVNVADTHDYWDPDPSQPLSYYPNLFLYPANGGRYTCVGRMFLSTEDRPRLGMKTLVLDTAQLLASGEFGATIVRWHASMGGPRREGSRPPPIPDPGLYAAVGEGFLFHRGSTEPVVLVASEQWEPAMQAILDMVRVMPASLVALGAILAFPYFLPAAKTNMEEFTDQVPLALALMRVPRGEAAGERHTKRLGAWSSAKVTVRDVTDGVPPPSGKGKDTVPLVLQLVRDRNEGKLAPITQRVDLVELTRVKQHLADPDKQGGKDRRKEMWRIGTAMESAALLLQRARGRHVPVSGETAKRAQEYLQARVPRASIEEPPEPAVVAPTGAMADASLPHHPPWLQRSEEVVAPSRPDRVEVVPVSVSDDPSLLKAAAPAALAPAATVPTGAAARPTEASVNATQLRAEIQRDLLRFIDERLSTISETAAQRISGAVGARIGTDLSAETDTKLSVARQQAALDLDHAVKQLQSEIARTVSPEALAALERRIADRLDKSEHATAEEARQVVAELEGRLRPQLGQASAGSVDERLASIQKQISTDLAKTVLDSEARTQQKLAYATGAPVDARTEEKISAALKLQAQEFARALQEAEARLVTRIGEASGRATALQADGTQQLRAALERRLSEGVEGQNRALSAVGSQLQARLQEVDAKQAQQAQALGAVVDQKVKDALQSALGLEVEKRLQLAVEPKFKEANARADAAVQAAGSTVLTALRNEAAATLADLKAQVQAVEDELRSTLSGQLDLHLREAADREIGVRETLEGRLQESMTGKVKELEARRAKEVKELEQRLAALIDTRQRDSSDRLMALVQEQNGRLGPSVDERVQAVETRLSARAEARWSEVQEAQVHATADLQVRMQSYFDTRLREAQEREREKYIELMARLKGEVDATVPRLIESPRFDAAMRERMGRLLETLRGDAQKLVEQRVNQAEERLGADQTEAVHRLELVEQELADRGKELLRLEESIRSDLDELDRRTAILSDRLVPVVKKTWLRIAELEKANPNSTDAEARINQVKRDLAREVRRLEGDISERTAELRERTETAIANQGKVWLTLIRQLSQLTDDRRALEQARAAPEPAEVNPMAPESSGGLSDLDALSSLGVRDRASRSERPGDDSEDEPEDTSSARRRVRRPGGR